MYSAESSESGVPSKLPSRLFILRAACAVFFLQWGVEKIVDPARTVRIIEYFYVGTIPVEIVPALGVLQILLTFAFFAGFKQAFSYGAVLVLHAISVVATWRQLLFPFEEGTHNHVFLTAVPVLAGLWLLFSLREHDTILTVAPAEAGAGR